MSDQYRPCKACTGRGEVEAGITIGRSYGWTDSHGVQEREAVQVIPNPLAVYPKTGEIWFLDTNKNHPLWGIAICAKCRGTGLEGIPTLE